MNNNLLQIKIKQRLNKLSSFDYDNLECWQIAEAFNKEQLEFSSRRIAGLNSKLEGNEQTINSIDDLQVLITNFKLTKSTENEIYYESKVIPDDYLNFKRVSFFAKTKDCPERKMIVYLASESDVDILLGDKNTEPSFEWKETFCTIVNNKIRIYTNNKFEVINPTLTYYRKPKNVEFVNCINLTTGNVNSSDVISEFKDDIVEKLIDGAAAILAGDIESIAQYQRELQNSERNN